MQQNITLYQAFGLVIRSEFKLPPLPLAEDQSAKPDVYISIADIDENGLEDPTIDAGWYQASPMQFWMHIDNVGYFTVSHGNRIVINPTPCVATQNIQLYLLGSCIGALLQQRNYLVIHGNAIRFGERCIIFAGPSGIGKSTLAAAFHQRGYDVLADDVCPVNQRGLVVPSFPQLKLWHDTAEKLDIDTSKLQRVHLDLDKYSFPFQQTFKLSLPLAAIYVLSSDDQSEFKIHELKGMKAFEALLQNSYRMFFLEGLGLMPAHFRHCSDLANRISVVHISRPEEGFQLDELINVIIADMKEKHLA